MMDRRRSPRFVFLASADAHTRTVSEALIEKADGDHFIVTTSRPAIKGEELIMRVSSPAGELTARAVRVVSSTQVPGDGATRFRLTLSVVAASAGLPPDLIQMS
jgi:hypothetical protein